MLDHEPLVSHMLGKHFTKKLLPQHFSLLLRRGSDCGACEVTRGQEEVGTEEIVFTKVLGSILRTVVPSPHPTPPKKNPPFSLLCFVIAGKWNWEEGHEEGHDKAFVCGKSLCKPLPQSQI